MALNRLTSTRDFFRVWFYWKYHAGFIFALILITSAIFLLATKPMYESRAKILILPRTTEGVIITADAELDRIDLVNLEDINTEIELLTSENVFRDTVASIMQKDQNFGLKTKTPPDSTTIFGSTKAIIQNALVSVGIKKPLSDNEKNIRILQSAVKVEPVATSNIIIVRLRSANPQAAASVLNELLRIYIRHHNQVYSKDEGVKFYSDQAAEYQIKLAEAEKKLKEFQGRWHIIALEAQHATRIDQLSELNNELKHIENSVDEAQSRINLLRKGIKNNLEITKEMRTIPSIVELESALVPLYIERSSILTRFTKSSREYQDVDDQINIILGHVRDEVDKAIRTEELELNILKARQGSLEQKIALTQKEADTLVQKEMALNDLTRQVQLLQENYMLYASKTEDARIFSESKKRNLANVSIAENASTPTEPSFPPKKLILMASLLVAIFASLGIPFILEFLDHRIKTADDIQTFLSLPVICVLPEVKGATLRKGEITNG